MPNYTVPGRTVQSPADVVIGAGATEPLPVPPNHTRRMVVQVTDGDENTVVRIRELDGTAGTGHILQLYGSKAFGAAEGAIAALEAENVGDAGASVGIQFEID